MGMARETKIQVTEMSVVSGRMDAIYVDIDGRKIRIPVPAEVKAYFNEQFVRPRLSPTQKRRFITVMNLLRAAYNKGRADAKNE